MKRLFAALVGIAFCASGALAQTQAPQGASTEPVATPQIKTASQEVLLDMVFRDKEGRPVHDISQNQVHVYEDGVQQKLTSFRLVKGGMPPAMPASEAGKPAPAFNPMRNVRIVTLVFQSLDVNSQRFFQTALKQILNMAPQPNLYFSIYVIDQSLFCIQPLTNDHAKLLASAKRATTWAYRQQMEASKSIQSQLEQEISGGEPQLTATLTSGPGSSGPTPQQIQSLVSYQMAKMQDDMLKIGATEYAADDAHTTLDGLLAVVKAESVLPGRKAVLYFNPWMNIPNRLKQEYRFLTSAANRANVTFYTVDPQGLKAFTNGGYFQNEGGNGQLSGALGEVRNQQLSGGVGEVSMSQTRAEDNALNSVSNNPQLWLRSLARDTGGVAILNTNNTEKPLHTVMDEVETYYEATYVPINAALNGDFRKISVTVDQPGIQVITRSGYFALPPTEHGQQLVAFEVPLLHAMDTDPLPQTLNFHVAAVRFSTRGPKVKYMLTIQAPQSELTFAPQADGKTATVDVPMMILVKNPAGDIVQKFSRNFAGGNIPMGEINLIKEGDLTYSSLAELSPGSYTLEAAMMDRGDNKAGVQKTPLVVPQPTRALAVSSVIPILKTERLKQTPTSAPDPYYVNGGKVVPDLNPTFKGGAGNYLRFYFVAYTNPADQTAPKLVMQFFKEGQYLGAAQVPLPAAQPNGRIPYIANLPADRFTPGSYEIRVNVVQGNATAQQKIDFKVD